MPSLDSQLFTSFSALALAQAIRDEKFSAADAVATSIELLRECHQLTQCVIDFEDRESLCNQLAQATGPLRGVPLAHKDMFDRKGRIATVGARIRRSVPPDKEATVLSKIKKTGAIQIASLHLSELCMGPTGHNYVIGHCRNPWDPSFITGGSSSGVAAAVSYGAVPAGLGSDTAGSLRLPAACCGVTSLKPTWGIVPDDGAQALAPSFDVIGFVARHVEDLATLLDVATGGNSWPRMTSDNRRHRIGVDAKLLSKTSPEVQRCLQGALQIFQQLGHVLCEKKFDSWAEFDEPARVIQLREGADLHRSAYQTRPNDFGPQVRLRLQTGFKITDRDLATAAQTRETHIQSTLNRTFAGVDFLFLPVMSEAVAKIADLDVGGDSTALDMLNRLVQFTRPINYLRLPALTLPTPRLLAMPMGFQLVARAHREADLLGLGHHYQQQVAPEVSRARP